MEIKDYLSFSEESKKYFFAEDIMSYIMLSSGFEPYFRIPTTERCFRLIPRAFNDLIETTVCFLYSRISVFNTFRSFEANEMLNTGTFFLFAHCLAYRYFPNGYNPQKLLYFCTYLAYVAVSFYKAGKTDIPSVAVSYIVRIMKSFDVPECEFWNSLSIAALRYMKIAFQCGFAKMSDFEFMKIQFVVNQSFKEQTADDSDAIIEGSLTDAVRKTHLLKISAESKMKQSIFDHLSVCSKSDQSKSEIEKNSASYEENVNRKLSDHSSTDIKESLEIGLEEKSIHEIKLGTKCTEPLSLSLKLSEFERQISLRKKYRVFQKLCGLLNGSDVSDFSENCKNLFNANQDFTSKDNAMDTEASRNLKSESDVTSFKNDGPDNTEEDSKYFGVFNQKTQSPTTSTHDKKFSSFICGDKCEFFAANESCKNSLNSTLNKESFSTIGNKSVRTHTPNKFPNVQKSETEDCPMKTVDFDICDQFVMDMAMSSGTDVELYGETLESFISNEDYFNSTFDILSVVHNMAKDYDTEILGVEAIY